jgi:hypothetical protein
MARMHLRSTAEVNASCFYQPEHLVMLPHFSSVGSFVFHRYSVSSFVVLGSALTEVALLPATGLRSALQANSCCVKSFAPASPSLAHPHEVPPLKRPLAANSYIVRYDYFLLVLHIAFREASSGIRKKKEGIVLIVSCSSFVCITLLCLFGFSPCLWFFFGGFLCSFACLCFATISRASSLWHVKIQSHFVW